MSNNQTSTTRSWAPAITKGTFLLLTLILSATVVYLVRSVLHAIILGLLFAMLLMPLNNRILAFVRNHCCFSRQKSAAGLSEQQLRKRAKRQEQRCKSIAATLSVVLVIVIVVVPLWLFGASIVHQGYAVTESAQKWISTELPRKLEQFINKHNLEQRYSKIEKIIHKFETGDFIEQKINQDADTAAEANKGSASAKSATPADSGTSDAKDTVATNTEPAVPRETEPHTGVSLSANLAQLAGRFMNFLKDILVRVLSRVGTVIFNFCIMLFVMYQFFYDGNSILNYFKRISPLNEDAQEQVATRIRDISKAVFLGIFGTAIIQGLSAIIIFKISGIPAFWGVILGICSIIPVVGTSIIWVPLVGYLCLIGLYGKALFIFISCGCIIANFDMIVRPLLMQKSGETGMSYMVLFLSILGGVQTFGLVGVLYGPLITGICSICLLIFSTQYKKNDSSVPPGTLACNEQETGCGQK